MTTYFIIDGDATASVHIENLMSNFSCYERLGTFNNSTEAFQAINETPPDFLILDVNMPELNGIELLKSLNEKPQTIVVSKKEEFALAAHGLNVVDYLLKPLTLSKISEALNKIKKRGPKDLEEIYMKTGTGIKRMRFSEIKYIEATGDYVRIYMLNEKITISGTLKNVELSLTRNQFVRVHKSYLVNLDFVDRITSFSINPSKENIPIGRKYKPMLNEKLNLL